ncbi:RraA family protein [Paraburkholderia silvatlantica]|uniref:RraA family protein n=1 Tax=Paraburkholderia silvatlantica TaxID=321895 RepID=UPI0037515588
MEDLESNSDRVHRLRRLDCCAVSDALDRLGLSGVVTGLLQQSGTSVIAGSVVTLKLGAGDASAGSPVHLGCTAIELSGVDNVIVVEQAAGVDAGSWGGILSLGARLKNIAGVVADGPVRDAHEAVRIGFPVFSRSTTARTARGRVVEKATNVPVVIGDVTVSPGDFVIADSSGVVFVSSAAIDAVLEAAENIAAREAAMAKALLGGEQISAVMGASYEQMLKR